ncbi:branched-chain amino acid ABC transporter permease [Dysosmobacter sp. Marseille-Q4140]|nr:branched-chain amino acid ABC transporter permease [Dysosmobacter sp. Marseille-Q4140]
MEKLKKMKKSDGVKAVIALIVLLFPLLVSGLSSASYFVLLGCFILVYILAASGLDILFGYCGQISLGHAGFFAIGAYGAAILDKSCGVPQLLSILLACVLAVIVAAVIAFPATKLRFHFLSLATIAFGEIMYSFISASPNNITGNFVGYFPNELNLFGFAVDSYTKFYYIGLVLAVVCLLIKRNLVASKTGRAMIAIRENVVAAGGMGINVRRYKMTAFCTSAFFVAFSGAMYAYLVRYINPSTFIFDQSVMFLIMLLFGGSGTLWGPVLGVIIVQLINEGLREFAQYQTLFYGVFILAVVLFMPSGLVNLRFGHKRKSEVIKNAED